MSVTVLIFPSVIASALSITIQGTPENFVFGSLGDDSVSEIIIDSQDNFIIAGITEQPIQNLNFLNNHKGETDVFVLKLTKDFVFLWGLYLGGSSEERSQEHFETDVAIDSSDNIVVVGTTTSSDLETINAYDDEINGTRDFFISKIDPSGVILFSTYLGGSQRDEGYSVAIDSEDNIFATGPTHSPDFPSGTLSPAYSGGGDIAISKLSEDGSLIWTQLVGGSMAEWSFQIAVDNLENAIIVGDSYSNDLVTENAVQDSLSGQNDVIVSKITPTGEIVFTTYFGGFNFDVPRNLYIDQENIILVTGDTWSTNFPTQNGFQMDHGSEAVFGASFEYADGFLFKLSETGFVQWSTYIGGDNRDQILSVASTSEYIIIAGNTVSSNFPGLSDTSNNQNAYLSILDPIGNVEYSYQNSGILSFNSIAFGEQLCISGIITQQIVNQNDLTSIGGIDIVISCHNLAHQSETTESTFNFLYYSITMFVLIIFLNRTRKHY